MNQEQIELRLLHQQHIKNMLNLEQERHLLNRENPYKQTLQPQNNHKSIPIHNLPILKSDIYTQQLLYHPNNRNNRQQNATKTTTIDQKPAYHPYTPTQAKIAQKCIQSILRNWNRDCQRFPNNIELERMIKYRSQQHLQQRLTSKGLEHIENLIDNAKNSSITQSKLSLKQKYSQNYRSTLPLDLTQPLA